MKAKLCILIFIFAITSFIAYSSESPSAVPNKKPLKNYFINIDGFQSVDNIDLSQEAYDMLKLDDYYFASYANAGQRVNLYIGYYYSANKAYASHSPLVCYPSQGWKLEGRQKSGHLNIGKYRINYDEVITSLGRDRELVIYWYQAYQHTTSFIYKNKILMAYNRLVNKNEQHAFVRIAVPFGKSDYATAKQSALAFINAFYPIFIDYIIN